MADVISKRKKVSPRAAPDNSYIVQDVMHCIWGNCSFQTTSFKELEDHAVDKHGCAPRKPKIPKEEREKRDIQSVSRWIKGYPELF